MIATFAVVGHPNKGKSSIVATLAENEQVPISAVPGTTHNADRFTFSIDDKPMYVLIDTPGFQRSKSVLEWLQARENNASDRAELIAEFVEVHQTDMRFRDECTLLRPIVEGAGILYVVDGTKPYGAEYDIEMEILRWSGQPRMALINMIGDGDYLSQWRQALGQYFSIVRVFDAMHANFTTRLDLLRAFGELAESWRPSLEQAIDALIAERVHRKQQSAQEIADSLIDCLQWRTRAALDDGDDVAALIGQLSISLQDRLRKREEAARNSVQAIYRHESLDREEDDSALLNLDLFRREGWELFGLSRTQLVVTGSVSGAIAGLGIDALVGGSSFLLGAGIGALFGGVSTWFGSDELAKTKVLGDALGGRMVEVGPVSQANFPWVILGRAWVHHHLVAERNHALRDAISMQLSAGENLMNRLPDNLRKDLGRVFKAVREGTVTTGTRQSIAELVSSVLGYDPLEEAHGKRSD